VNDEKKIGGKDMAGKDTESVIRDADHSFFCFAVCFDFVLCILHHHLH